MFALAEVCLHSTTFNFEVVTVYMQLCIRSHNWVASSL
jgi:hypothetical protein